jgi:RNA polymerase sigma-70 factor, ECF subfamily
VSVEDAYDGEVTELYCQYSCKVLAFLCGMGCDRGLAEEITSDAFIVARRRWADVRDFDHPAGYVFAVARRLRSKRQKVHDGLAGELCSGFPETWQAGGDLAQQVTERLAIVRALEMLPVSQRTAVCLRYVADLPEALTAQIMNVSAGAVKRYASDGKGALRKLLAEFRPRLEKDGR